MLEQLMQGFVAAATIGNFLYIICGIALGIIFGVLPGLGSVTAIALLIPITFYMSPMTAIGFLVGVNKGGTSGGAIPAILLNAPGTPEATATTYDGYPLCKKGQPEKAMKMALYSSVTGDMFSDSVLILLAAPFATVALMFGPAEITSIIFFAFTMIAALSGTSLLKGIAASALGVFLSTMGLDPVTGNQRMTFQVIELFDGISVNALAIGALALSSIMSQWFTLRSAHLNNAEPVKLAELDREKQRLSFSEYFACKKTILRSAFIGTGVGMLPGLGVTLAAFLGYGSAKRASKTPEKFGTGHLEGIAATEAANSAVVGGQPDSHHCLGHTGQYRGRSFDRSLHDSRRHPGPHDDAKPRRSDIRHLCVHAHGQCGPCAGGPDRHPLMGPDNQGSPSHRASPGGASMRGRSLHPGQFVL